MTNEKEVLEMLLNASDHCENDEDRLLIMFIHGGISTGKSNKIFKSIPTLVKAEILLKPILEGG